MTFELSPQHASAREKARSVAETIAGRADAIDRDATIPADVVREIDSLAGADLLTLVLAVEQVAAASAAAACVLGAREGASVDNMSGLRGAPHVEDSPRGQLVLAGVALGIGKAATEAALQELRRSTAAPRAEVEKPQWVIADVATELEAARLLTYKAARSATDGDIAVARLMASAAAARAVDGAIRVIGPVALRTGHLIERLARDVRAVSVLIGTEEDQRAMAAEALLPG